MEKIKSAPALLFAFSGSEQTKRRTGCSGDEQACDDSALVRKAMAGERDAFGRLYENYGAMVHGILAARVPFDEVADLTQEVFLIAFRRIDTLRDARTFGGWLATIARNRACDFHRAPRRAEELDERTAAP
jgi:RNA polymerase sigma-70 factor (ECF subfamily)